MKYKELYWDKSIVIYDFDMIFYFGCENGNK